MMAKGVEPRGSTLHLTSLSDPTSPDEQGRRRGNNGEKAPWLCAPSTRPSRGLDGAVAMRARGDADGRGREPCGSPRTGWRCERVAVRETSRPEAMGWTAGRALARATPSIHPMLRTSMPTRTAIDEAADHCASRNDLMNGPSRSRGTDDGLPHLQGRPSSTREAGNRGSLRHCLSR